jgi:hypothetical protein
MANGFRTDFNFGTQIPDIELASGKYFPAMQDMPDTGGMTGSGGPDDVFAPGSNAKKVNDLMAQGYSFDEAMKLVNLDTVKPGQDDRLFDFIESRTSPERLRETLALKNQFEAERLAQAAPYNLLYQIPRTLTQAAILPATVALGSAKTASDALARMGGINIGGGALNPNAGGYF